MSSAPNPELSDADQLEAAADEAIAACGGDAREAVKALIVANHYLETDLEKLKAAASMGYARGKLLKRLRRCRVIERIGMIEMELFNVRFVAHYGLNSDIPPCPKSPNSFRPWAARLHKH